MLHTVVSLALALIITSYGVEGQLGPDMHGIDLGGVSQLINEMVGLANMESIMFGDEPIMMKIVGRIRMDDDSSPGSRGISSHPSIHHELMKTNLYPLGSSESDDQGQNKAKDSGGDRSEGEGHGVHHAEGHGGGHEQGLESKWTVFKEEGRPSNKVSTDWKSPEVTSGWIHSGGHGWESSQKDEGRVGSTWTRGSDAKWSGRGTSEWRSNGAAWSNPTWSSSWRSNSGWTPSGEGKDKHSKSHAVGDESGSSESAESEGDIEEREYPFTSLVCGNISDFREPNGGSDEEAFNKEVGDLFASLYAYISGDNSEGKKMAANIPQLSIFTPPSKMTFCFWLSQKEDFLVPSPTEESRLWIWKHPATTFYSKTYYTAGLHSYDVYQRESMKMSALLSKMGLKHDTHQIYFSLYRHTPSDEHFGKRRFDVMYKKL